MKKFSPVFFVFLLFTFSSFSAAYSGSFEEKFLLKKYPHLIKKTATGYTVFPKTGEKILIENEPYDGGESVTTFELDNYYSDIGYFGFTIGYYEASSYMMVSAKNGNFKDVTDYPVISPDNKTLIVVSQDEGMGSGLHGIEIYKILPSGIEKTQTIEARYPSFHSWIDVDNARIIQRDSRQNETNFILRHDITSDEWKLEPTKENFPSRPIIIDNKADQKEIEKFFSDKKFLLSQLKTNVNISNIPAHFLADKEIVSELVKQSGPFLEYVSDDLKDDEEIVELAIKDYPEPFKFASPRLKDNEEFVKKMMGKEPNIFRYTSDRIRDDRKIFEDLGLQTRCALEYASEKLRDDKKLALQTIENCRYIIAFLSDRLKDDREVVEKALEKNPGEIEHASNRIKSDKKLILRIIVDRPYYLKSLPEKIREDKEVILVALSKYKAVINSPTKDFNDRNFISALLKEDPSVIAYLPKEIRDDSEFMKKAASARPPMFQYASERLRDNEEFLIELLRNWHSNAQETYPLISDRLRSDKDFLFKALKAEISYNNILQYASPKLLDDVEFMEAAVNIKGGSFKYASKCLRNDRDLIVKIIKNNSAAYCTLEDKFKNDLEIFRMSSNLSCAPYKFKDDENIVLEATKQGEQSIGIISSRLKANKNFLLKLIAVYPNYFSGFTEAISDKLKNDPEILDAIKKRKAVHFCKFAKTKQIDLSAFNKPGSELRTIDQLAERVYLVKASEYSVDDILEKRFKVPKHNFISKPEPLSYEDDRAFSVIVLPQNQTLIFDGIGMTPDFLLKHLGDFFIGLEKSKKYSTCN